MAGDEVSLRQAARDISQFHGADSLLVPIKMLYETFTKRQKHLTIAITLEIAVNTKWIMADRLSVYKIADLHRRASRGERVDLVHHASFVPEGHVATKATCTDLSITTGGSPLCHVIDSDKDLYYRIIRETTELECGQSE